jgi:H+-transporting ATPase
MPGFDRERVLALAKLASSEGDQDPIDAAVRAAAGDAAAVQRLVRFVPFDPATKMSEAFVLDQNGRELRITKGAFHAVAELAQVPEGVRRTADGLAGRGHRIIAVATGSSSSLRLAGLVAISDPPRDDSAELIGALRGLGVRTVMVTGDSAVTAAAIARKVGVAGEVAAPEAIRGEPNIDKIGVFARVVPEEKFRLVRSLQRAGHVVGMCGDGTNDAPALRQAQIGIAVSSATDVAKAAAGMVMTEPGLGGIVDAVREGRVGFQRLLTYTFNMLVKKIEIVLFLAVGLALTGHPVMTPVLMVLMLMTNDFLAMSLTTERASSSVSPSRWRMRNITGAAIALGACKLVFSTAMLAFGRFALELGPGEMQTFAFVTLVFGAQAVLYVVRERRPMWSSRPSHWVLTASAIDIGIVSTLALSGIFMEPLPWHVIVGALGAVAVFAAILDRIKLPVTAALKVE